MQSDSITDASSKRDFSVLSAAEQELIRAKQKHAKEVKKARKVENGQPKERNSDKTEKKQDYPSTISKDEYFAACPERYFYDPQVKATEVSLSTVMQLVDDNAVIGADKRGQDVTFAKYQYIIFSSTQKTIWDPIFFARLAYEGFFTITTANGPHRCGREPLPELQPFYGVVTWENFNDSKTVKKCLGKLRQQFCGKSRRPSVVADSNERTIDYHMYTNADADGTYKKLDAHQKKNHGSNWMTPKYFETLKLASADPNINFKLHTIELYDGPVSSGAKPPVLIAGEIGYSIGQIYTSLSGFYEVDGCGTVQLVILGQWLERKKYAFWSLGHCYSPQMEYKRQLGHRIYPRADFLQSVREHRGSFSGTDMLHFSPFADREECNIPYILGVSKTSELQCKCQSSQLQPKTVVKPCAIC